MNPIAQKILDIGGTVLKEPLINDDGEINPKCAEELFKELDREPNSKRINRFLDRKNQNP